MKKILIIILFIVSIVLAGCSKSQKIIVTLSPENFCEYFIIDFETNESGGKVKVNVEINPRNELEIKDINVKVRFAYNYISPQNSNKTIYGYNDVHFTDNLTFNKMTVQIGPRNNYVDLKVVEFVIIECTGEIETYDKPIYKNKGFVTNRLENEKIFQEMEDSLEKVNSFLDATHYQAKIQMNIKQINKEGMGALATENVVTKVKLDPLYIETIANKITTVCKYEGDQAYSFEIDEDRCIKKEKISIEEIKSIALKDLLQEKNIGLSFIFSPNILKFEHLNDGYLVTGYYKDFCSEEQYQLEMDSLKSLVPNPKQILDEALCKMYFEVKDEGMYLDLLIDIFNISEIYVSTLRVIIDISFTEFTELNLYGRNFFIFSAYDFNRVKYKNQLSNRIYGRVTNNRYHIYLYDLEAGDYIIERPKNKLYQVMIYDKNLNEVKSLKKNPYINSIGYTFTITTGGEYYVELTFDEYYNHLDSPYEFYMKRDDW